MLEITKHYRFTSHEIASIGFLNTPVSFGKCYLITNNDDDEPCFGIRTLIILIHLILYTALWDRFYYFIHFRVAQGHISAKWWAEICNQVPHWIWSKSCMFRLPEIKPQPIILLWTLKS